MGDKWHWTKKASLPSQRCAHLPLLEEIMVALEGLGWNGRDHFGVQLALEEALSNAIRHGNKLDDSKTVAVECKASPVEFWIQIEDQGEGFNPDQVADCRSPEGLEHYGGRGLLLIQSYMTSVEHNKAGNRVVMTKTRTREDGPDGLEAAPNES
ncbi:MAG: ATP-binding protein [Planctomycetales bacterium]|nr:ATP-binding protein [Planctomycetales bacterium]